MGRYLDLVRDAANIEDSEVSARGIGAQSDRKGSSGRLSSLMSQTDRLMNESLKTEAFPSFVSDLTSTPHTEVEATPAARSTRAVSIAATATKATKATELVQDAWCDVDEERAAVIEHDVGIPHSWAEGFAKLRPDRAPCDVPRRRWAKFLADARAFLSGDFREKAEALGWTGLDLFGCDSERPFARIDQAGLLWLLNGDRLVALTTQTARIETVTGAPQTFRRNLSDTGRVFPWELADGEPGGKGI
jgi:hypothetical protein